MADPLHALVRVLASPAGEALVDGPDDRARLVELVRAEMAKSSAAPTREPCTGVSASWCHNCGDCTCERDEQTMEWGEADPVCPLHGQSSTHGTDDVESPFYEAPRKPAQPVDNLPAVDPSACPLCARPDCAHWNAPDPETDNELFSAERAKAEADCIRNKVTIEEWRARATGRIVAWDVIRDGGEKIARVGTARLAADFLRAEPAASHAEPVFAIAAAPMTVGAALAITHVAEYRYGVNGTPETWWQARADGYGRRWREDKLGGPGWSLWASMAPCDDERERPCRLVPLAAGAADADPNTRGPL